MTTYADVAEARALLEDVLVATPCVRSSALSELLGVEVFLKLENLQRTGSFKVRGSGVKLQRLSAAERARGAVAVSAGNHAQGVAFHGTRLGIPTTIVMPTTTPYTKVRRAEAYGARVVLHGRNLSEAYAHAQVLESRGLVMIHPYADHDVIAGGGTVGLEMLEAHDFDAIVVPVGGGGLISGIALAVKERAPRTRVIGVRVAGGEAPTLAEGIAVKQLGEINAAIVATFVDDMLTVDEPSLERAVHLLLDEEKVVAEGAGAAALAALLRFPEAFAGQRVGLVVSGGNIDTGLLASVILRARFQEGRVARLRVQIVDSPGALAQISTLLAEHHANVVDVSHHRSFSGVPAKCAELDFTIEMRHPRDIDSILSGLHASAFETTLLAGSSNNAR